MGPKSDSCSVGCWSKWFYFSPVGLQAGPWCPTARQGGCWEPVQGEGELPKDADPSWPGTVFCWALWNVSQKCPLQNLLEREHARSFLLKRQKEKKKKRRKKKALWISAASKEKSVNPLASPSSHGSESQWPSQFLQEHFLKEASVRALELVSPPLTLPDTLLAIQ